MREPKRALVWVVVGLALMALAVPWFMWGNDAVIAGLPVWVWWHAGWLGLTAVVFWVFTKRAWGLGVEEVSADG